MGTRTEEIQFCDVCDREGKTTKRDATATETIDGQEYTIDICLRHRMQVDTAKRTYRNSLYKVFVGPLPAEQPIVDFEPTDEGTPQEGTPTRNGKPADSKSARKRKAATRTTRGRKDVDLKAVRIWAGENGYEIGERGRVPQTIVDAYKAAQAA